MSTIYYAADSTVQYNGIKTFPQTGIGQVINLFLKPEVTVSNHAKNGRSTKSFLSEGRFEPIKEAIGEGDFLFIQFGHNDEKIEDELRYTDPQGEFKDNLRLYCKTALEKKAHPVLISPIQRREFVSEHVLSEGKHGPYAKAMEDVAKELNVAYIDLSSMSRKMLEEAGEVASREWHMHLPKDVYPYHYEGLTDDTHLKYRGAVIYAGCIARGLSELGGVYADLLLDDIVPSLPTWKF